MILYIFPECLRGYEALASDVYSAGLVLNEMLAGTLPYPKHALSDALGPAEIKRLLAEVQSVVLPPPFYFDWDIAADVDSVVARSMHLEEGRRFQDGIETANAIAACPHVSRHPEATEPGRLELRAVVEIAAGNPRMDEAVDRRDRRPSLVRGCLPRLRQLRLQAYSMKEQRS